MKKTIAEMEQTAASEAAEARASANDVLRRAGGKTAQS